MTGRFFCRVCRVRAKAKDRVGDYESEVERIAELMQAHSPRTVAETLAGLRRQEKIALRGTFSIIDDEARKAGVKDKYLTSFLPVMKEQLGQWKGGPRASLDFLQKL
ncbi:hypothetical protein FRC10_002040, partial [Ceratobasidium sp. 414]